jgi:hypothetical protein
MSEMSWVDYTWHDYLKVDGKLIAERFCPVGATCSSTTAWRYFVTDSLGSVATVTDSTASPDAPHTARDAYGRRSFYLAFPATVMARIGETLTRQID